ncbi:MAG: nuclear transport factor 2 family protein [Acidimicrobiales bacterium]|jgi:hypothetical protein
MSGSADLRALSVAYAGAVDTLDGPAFAALFTVDGELWVPDGSRGDAPTICRAGTDALEAIPSGLRRYVATYHRVGPATYAVDGDSATGEVTGVAHHLGRPAGGPAGTGDEDRGGLDTIWYLRYADDYRRLDTGWRIARRVLHLRRIEERPVGRIGPGR